MVTSLDSRTRISNLFIASSIPNPMGEVPTIFYSWQSDTPGGLNRCLVRDALEAAIDEVGIKGEQALRFDHDTKDETGTRRDGPQPSHDRLNPAGKSQQSRRQHRLLRLV